MKCEDIEHMMMDYLENNLDLKTRIAIENHLSVCERCLEIMRDSQKILGMMSRSVMERPPESLRSDFYRMLHEEIRRNTGTENYMSPGPKEHWYDNIFLRIAAGVALLICGAFAGSLLNFLPGNVSDERLDRLQAEVTDMRREMMFSMIKETSSSYRLQAIGYTDELNSADDEVIITLLNTLNNDDNVNVRIAAAFSLGRFTDNRMVCDSLIASLPRQSDPVVQVTLINILVDIKEKSALRILQQIIRNEKTLEEVRSVAEAGAKELML